MYRSALVILYDTASLATDVNTWVAFGMGKNFHLLSVNTTREYLGEQKCCALPFFWQTIPNSGAEACMRLRDVNYASIPGERKEICMGGLESVP